jgi:hypothetical protein
MAKNKNSPADMKRAMSASIALFFQLKNSGQLTAKEDPAVFHYYRLFSEGFTEDDAAKLVVGVTALLVIAKKDSLLITKQIAEKVYEGLPHIDPEKYLYALCH